MCNEFSFFITLIVNNNFTSSVWANLYPTIDMFYRYVDQVVTASDDYYEGVRGNVCVCVLPYVCLFACVCVRVYVCLCVQITMRRCSVRRTG
jgi:hypothetical protein